LDDNNDQISYDAHTWGESEGTPDHTLNERQRTWSNERSSARSDERPSAQSNNKCDNTNGFSFAHTKPNHQHIITEYHLIECKNISPTHSTDHYSYKDILFSILREPVMDNKKYLLKVKTIIGKIYCPHGCYTKALYIPDYLNVKQILLADDDKLYILCLDKHSSDQTEGEEHEMTTIKTKSVTGQAEININEIIYKRYEIASDYFFYDRKMMIELIYDDEFESIEDLIGARNTHHRDDLIQSPPLSTFSELVPIRNEILRYIKQSMNSPVIRDFMPISLPTHHCTTCPVSPADPHVLLEVLNKKIE